MASTYLSRTPSSSSNRRTWTWSAWVKRSNLSTGNQVLFQALDGSFPEKIQFTSSDRIEYDHDIAGTDYTIYSDFRCRDTNGWYHIVVAKDTTQATETDRIKVYVNGEQISMTEEALGYPGQNYEGAINKNVIHNIGANNGGSSEVFSGCMSHVHFVDGTALAPTVFGSTDSTTGEWKINTSPSYTVGTNGFFILKDGNSLTDQSANSNNFSLSNGTLTKTEDNPSNIFCTMNPLHTPKPGQIAMSSGNTDVYGNDSVWQRSYGALGAKSVGKWYYEYKCTAINNYNNRLGWDSIDLINEGDDNYYSGLTLDGNGELRGGVRGYNNYDPNSVQMTQAYSGGNFSYGVNDYLGMAIDLDNQTISVYKNGNLEINAYSYSGASNCSILKSRGHFIAPSVNFHSTSGNANTSSFNFGNG